MQISNQLQPNQTKLPDKTQQENITKSSLQSKSIKETRTSNNQKNPLSTTQLKENLQTGRKYQAQCPICRNQFKGEFALLQHFF